MEAVGVTETVRLAIEVLAPGGDLWVATNTHNLRPGTLEKWLGQGAAHSRRRLSVLETHGLPPDRPTSLAHPEGRYLEVMALRAD